jgi:hypothetical protein
LRPPLAHEQLERLWGELGRIHLRHPFADGTTAVDLDPLSLRAAGDLAWLAAACALRLRVEGVV